MEDVRDLLERLIAVPGPSGFEDAVAIAVRDELGELGTTTSVDSIGNLVLRLPASRDDAPSLMLMAHMDQVGLLVKYVDPTGFLYCERNGLIDERTILAAQLDVWTDAGSRPAVLGVRSRHLVDDEELRRPLRIEDLWVDVGARSAEAVAELGIQIGAPVTIRSTPVHLNEHTLAGPSIDNRAGCAALVTVARRAAVRERDVELVFVWSTQEEVGSRGAKVAAQTLQPTIAVVIDTLPAGDPSTLPRHATSVVGGGPVIRVQDARAGVGTIYSPSVRRSLQEVARSASIPHQLDVFPTWTDACEVHLAGRGIPTGGVFVPRLCSHSPNEILDLRDLVRTIELLDAFVEIEAEEARRLATRPAFPLGRGPARAAS
jgi:endoglucanase